MGGRGSIDVGRHGGIHMAEALLEIEGVEVRRGMGIVLSNFSLDLHSGDILILQGINGSGKSTVIETASRLLPLEHGAVKHHGKMTIDSDGRRVHPRHPFGAAAQQPSCCWITFALNLIALSLFACKPGTGRLGKRPIKLLIDRPSQLTSH